MRHLGAGVLVTLASIAACGLSGSPAQAGHKAHHDIKDHGHAKHRPPAAEEGEAPASEAAQTPAGIEAPTWRSDYRWEEGDGYEGWSKSGSGYVLSRGRTSGSGLWLAPKGGRHYGRGHAEWRYAAPGTTRIVTAVAKLTYRPRVLSHHCIRVALVADADRERAGRRICGPAGSDTRPKTLTVELFDRAALTRALILRLERPCKRASSRRGNACRKFIPAATAEKNGVRFSTVRMVLVDDDQPTVATSGPFAELDGTYIDGRSDYGLRLEAADAGSGVAALRLEHAGWPGPQPLLLDHNAVCDAHHHTAALGARVCSADTTVNLTVRAAELPEGNRSFSAVATDVAGNDGTRDWRVMVDRTAPMAPAALEMTGPTETMDEMSFSWTTSGDPALPDGTPGAGLTGSEYRYRRGDNPMTDWGSTTGSSFILPFAFDGERIQLEVRTVDAVGNRSAATQATFVVDAAVVEDPKLDALAAEHVAEHHGMDLATARKWMDVQNLSEGVNERIADSAAGRGYAGVWFDNESRRVKVGLKEGTQHAPVREILEAQGIAASTDIVVVDHTDRELSAGADEVKRRLSDDADLDLVVISRRTNENAVHVEYAGGAGAELEARVREAAQAAPVRVVLERSEAATLAAEDLQCEFPYCDPPGRGGLGIFSIKPNEDGKIAGCTAGFNALSRSDEKAYLLTAGHCFEDFARDRSDWATGWGSDSGPGYEIGPKHAYFDDKRGDAGIIRIHDLSNWGLLGLKPWVIIYRSSSDSTTRNPHYSIRGTSFSQVGRVLCMTGAVTGSRCGTVTDLGVGEQNYGEMYSCGMDKGDSGGPVVRHHLAYGMVVALRRKGLARKRCVVAYQGIRAAQDALNVDVVTAR